MLHTPTLARQTPQALLAVPPRSEPETLVRQPLVADDLGMGALLRFRSMMALEGQTVQVARMCFDRLYAYDRIALAHASASDPLRRLALELFQAYHRRDEMGNMPA
jgi:hypothetical protein